MSAILFKAGPGGSSKQIHNSSFSITSVYKPHKKSSLISIPTLCFMSQKLYSASNLLPYWDTTSSSFFNIFNTEPTMKKSHHCWPLCWLARFLPGTSFKLTRCLQLLYTVGGSLPMLKMWGSGLPRSFSQESKPKPYFHFRDSCLFLSLGVGVWMTPVGVWTQTFIKMVHFEIRK